MPSSHTPARWRGALGRLAALVLVVGAPAWAAPPRDLAAPLAGSFKVNIANDSNTADDFLSLREALLVARGGTGPNGLGGPASPNERVLLGGCTFDGSGNVIGGCGTGLADTITFSPTLGANPVITLVGPLPAITDTAATSVLGDSNNVFPIVEAGSIGGDALLISSNHNLIRGLTLRNAPGHALTITGNSNTVGSQLVLVGAGGYGLNIDGGDQNQILGAIVGVTAIGSVACGSGNDSGGIWLHNTAISNTIASSTIHCNTGFGVLISGSGTTGNVLRSNSIRAQIGNGVAAIASTHHNDIGQTGFGNLISGNSVDGVLIGGGSSYNHVYSNIIGLNGTGAVPEGNNGRGVWITGGAHHNHVGETFATTERNIISSNGHTGVTIDYGATLNLVESNYIGLNLSGTAGFGNVGPGVLISGTDNNTIGSSTSGAAQYIAYNGVGVSIQNGNNNFVGQTNLIGVAGNGVNPMGNAHEGVLIQDGSGNLVLASLIAHNGLPFGAPGIAVRGSTAQNNKLEPFRVFGNGGLPIDLNSDGHTPNDPGDGDLGPNGLLNYPVVTSFSSTTVTGTVCANCTVLMYLAFGNPAGPGGGAYYADSASANGAGVWSMDLPGGLTRLDVTFLTCLASCAGAVANSEFSPRLQSFLPLARK